MIHCLEKLSRTSHTCHTNAYTCILSKSLQHGAIFWSIQVMQMFMDAYGPNLYMCQMDLFSYSSLCFSFLSSSQRHYNILLSCWDPHPIAEILSNPRSIPLPLPQLCSDHPLRFQHYANQAPKLWPTPKTSNTLPSLSMWYICIQALMQQFPLPVLMVLKDISWEQESCAVSQGHQENHKKYY